MQHSCCGLATAFIHRDATAGPVPPEMLDLAIRMALTGDDGRTLRIAAATRRAPRDPRDASREAHRPTIAYQASSRAPCRFGGKNARQEKRLSVGS